MKRSILICCILITLSCKSPFNTKTTDGDLFVLSLNHNIERIMPTGEVLLSWTEIAVENFDKYKIEKKRDKDSNWKLVAELNDPFQLAYIDIIDDDDDLTYRVSIINDEGLAKWSQSSITIPKTTLVTIPDEYSTIQEAVDSELLDDGDEILVKAGLYYELIRIENKDIIINSESGFQNTTIVPDTLESGSSSPFSTIKMNSGRINGFTIRDAVAEQWSGGGIQLFGNASLTNCSIINNHSGKVGGGIYMGAEASIYNCIIFGNSSGQRGNGIYINSGSGEIINNTIVENDIVFTGDCSSLVFCNNIIYNINPAVSPDTNNDIINFTIDYSIFSYDIGHGSNNLTDNPLIKDYVVFDINQNSPCIDAGHPDKLYNDKNGSRNDIGTYGGPRNEKDPSNIISFNTYSK